MLRIIAGKYKSLHIDAPNVSTTRPTTDKVREAIMSSLQNEINSCRVLDLFGGSGALGLEALSRGAASCVFCDSSKSAIKTIHNNLNKLKEEHAEVFLGDYRQVLKQLGKKNYQFDLVFIDPPYKMKEAYEIVRSLLKEYHLLSEHALLVEESDTPLNGTYGKSKDYHYGIVHVRITREVTL